MTNKLPILQEEKENPWYQEGLRFKCTGCGQCCTGAPGFVWVSKEDIEKISKHLNISIKEFHKRYLRKVGKRYSLLENPVNFDCIFLEGKKCEIYEVRPTQCRTYPWWPTQIESLEAWNEAAKYCEGITPSAPLVKKEDIENQIRLYNEKHPKEES